MSEQTLEPIRYNNGHLEVLDQTQIPQAFVFDKIETVQQGWDSIADMKVRGAPAIAIVAIFTVCVQAHKLLAEVTEATSVDEVAKKLIDMLTFLKTSRPTAVNLFIESDAKIDLINAFLKDEQMRSAKDAAAQLLKTFLASAERIAEVDIAMNTAMSSHGSAFIQQLLSAKNKKSARVLTHCNTGALATSKYGTALGVIRFLYKNQFLEHAYCTETRPYNQGARLTAFELVYEKIPSTLIVDSAVSYLFSLGKVDVICVGADRICANGDTANKIGTFQVALAAKYHNIPFFVVAPTTSIDSKLGSGDKIHIEERKAEEITMNAMAKKRAVAEGINVWNPGFDVTPGKLIAGIITECGVIDESYRLEDGTLDVNAFLKKHNKL